jgi:hypothetical protein
MELLLQKIEFSKQLLMISAAGAVLWFVYRGASKALGVVDDVTTGAADAWVDFNNPVVGAVIRLKPQYFNNGVLTSEAFKVISEGYPDFFRVAFTTAGKLKPEYTSLLDGQPITNEQFT